MRKLVLLAPLALLAVAATVGLPLAGDSAALAQRAEAKQTLAYGDDRLQTVDYWPGASTDAPLVLFVHGGGWSRVDKWMLDGSDKLRHWRAQGYAVASANYRLVPDATD